MNNITQKGSGNQASTGDNSPNISNSKVNINSKQKLGWFTSGILLPVVAGVIVEIIKEGKVSQILGYLANLFK